jgi:uncharacterized membrane protein YgcG
MFRSRRPASLRFAPPPGLGLRRVAVTIALAATGCTPKIGDECGTVLDCSTTGDRLCDLTQPGGYCTLFNCEPDTCPEEANCVLFRGELDPACGTVDDGRFGRFGQTFCMRRCEEVSDCRAGYDCVRPVDHDARVLDTETDTEDPQDTKVCIAVSAKPAVPAEPPGVCFPGDAPDLVPYSPAGGAGGTGGAGGAGGAGGGGAGGAGGAGGGGAGGAGGTGGAGGGA